MAFRALASLALIIAAWTGVPAASDGLSAASSRESAGPHRFVSLLRSAVQYDYDVHESPAALRDDSDLVVVGRFASVTEGRTIYGIGTHATLAVDVERVVAGLADSAAQGQVFLELVTSAGASVADYREMLPGGRVLLFLDDRSDIEGVGTTGAPDDAPIFALQSPLGFILEDGGGVVGGYEDLDQAPPAWRAARSFDAFVADIGG